MTPEILRFKNREDSSTLDGNFICKFWGLAKTKVTPTGTPQDEAPCQEDDQEGSGEMEKHVPKREGNFLGGCDSRKDAKR